MLADFFLHCIKIPFKHDFFFCKKIKFGRKNYFIVKDPNCDLLLTIVVPLCFCDVQCEKFHKAPLLFNPIVSH